MSYDSFVPTTVLLSIFKCPDRNKESIGLILGFNQVEGGRWALDKVNYNMVVLDGTASWRLSRGWSRVRFPLDPDLDGSDRQARRVREAFGLVCENRFISAASCVSDISVPRHVICSFDASPGGHVGNELPDGGSFPASLERLSRGHCGVPKLVVEACLA